MNRTPVNVQGATAGFTAWVRRRRDFSSIYGLVWDFPAASIDQRTCTNIRDFLPTHISCASRQGIVDLTHFPAWAAHESIFPFKDYLPCCSTCNLSIRGRVDILLPERRRAKRIMIIYRQDRRISVPQYRGQLRRKSAFGATTVSKS